MPLPRENSLWLPREWAPAFDRYRLNEALWLNDTEKLRSILQGGAVSTPEGRTMAEQRKRGGLVLDLLRRWFWARVPAQNEKRTDLPVPIGANLIDLSAAQLMAEAPRFRVVERDPKTGRVKTKKGAVQDRLDRLANSDDAHMTLLEGASVAAAIGGAVLTAGWDVGDPERESVWFDVVGADCAIPEFNAAGKLVAVSTWQEYDARKGTRVYRHFTRHSLGKIEHALFLGTPQGVGKLVRLDDDNDATGLGSIMQAEGVTLNETVAEFATGLDRLTAAFWRNRPTVAWRRSGNLSNLGRSDFELVEPLLDAYSEAWGSMMRDVRLGKARLLVPMGMLELADSNRRGSGAVYDTDREIYTEIGGLDPEAGTNTVKDYQADLRWKEHLSILAGIKGEILDRAGWSMNSYGKPVGTGGEGGQQTATEVNDRTTKSERTRDEKALLFRSPANPFMRMLMQLDASLYPKGGGIGDLPELSIDFPDVSQVDPEKQAREFSSLASVNRISIEQTVRERYRNWDDDDVQAEVDRIWADLARMEDLTAVADPVLLDRTDPNEPEPPAPADPDDGLPEPSPQQTTPSEPEPTR